MTIIIDGAWPHQFQAVFPNPLSSAKPWIDLRVASPQIAGRGAR
jgi:hypothetical protein